MIDRQAQPGPGDARPPSRGILYPARLPTFCRIEPPAAVHNLVRWFWIPEWDIPPGRVSRQHVIAFPACNLVIGADEVELSGPSTRAGHRDLVGKGWVVGALLRPAAVAALIDEPAAIRDHERPFELPEQVTTAVRAAMTLPAPQRHDAAIEAFGAWLAAAIPAPEAEALLANRMADLLDTETSIHTVEEAAARLHTSVRTLQRLAKRYVGLPPGAMIRRRRLQEAAERVRTDPTIDLAAVAADLGYADHAHLTNDFRSMLGFTPSTYRAAEPS